MTDFNPATRIYLRKELSKISKPLGIDEETLNNINIGALYVCKENNGELKEGDIVSFEDYERANKEKEINFESGTYFGTEAIDYLCKIKNINVDFVDFYIPNEHILNMNRRNERLQRFIDLKAPRIIVINEINNIREWLEKISGNSTIQEG